MSDGIHSISSLMNNHHNNILDLITEKKFETIDREKIIEALSKDKRFENFKKGLKPYIIDALDFINTESDPAKSPDVNRVLNEIQTTLYDYLKPTEESPMTEVTFDTKMAVVGGFLLLTGIAIGVWYLSKKNASNESESKTSDIKLDIPGAVKSVMDRASGKAQSDKKSPEAPKFSAYNLLLVIPANRLPDTLKKGDLIDIEEVKNWINVANKARCFQQCDEMKITDIKNNLKTDDHIDYKSENDIFLNLMISAAAPIINSKTAMELRTHISNTEAKLIYIAGLASIAGTEELYRV